MQAFYARGGFAPSHQHLRLKGIGRADNPDPRLVPLDTLPFATIAAYDHSCFGVGREAFLRHWIDRPGIRATLELG